MLVFLSPSRRTNHVSWRLASHETWTKVTYRAVLHTSVCNVCVRNANGFYSWTKVCWQPRCKMFVCIQGQSIFSMLPISIDFSGFFSQKNSCQPSSKFFFPFFWALPVLSFACDKLFPSFWSPKTVSLMSTNFWTTTSRPVLSITPTPSQTQYTISG